MTLTISIRDMTKNYILLLCIVCTASLIYIPSNVYANELNAESYNHTKNTWVFGESLNPTPYYILHNKQTSQQTENLTIVLFEIDPWKNIWIDGMGVRYLQVSDDRFDRIIKVQ